MNVVKRTAIVMSLAGVLLSAGIARAEVITYDAALGTVPTEQGWNNELANSGSVGDYQVEDATSGKALHLNTWSSDGATNPDINSWNAKSVSGFDFTSSDATVLTAGIDVNKSNYGEAGAGDKTFWRAGYALTMTDRNNRHIILGIGDSEVRLTTDSGNWFNTNSSVVATLDTTVPIDYKLVAQDSLFKLFIGNAADPLLTLGIGTPNPAGDRQNTFRFGDISQLAGSDTWVSYVNASTVPEPSSLLLFAGMMGLGMVCYRRRKRHQ